LVDGSRCAALQYLGPLLTVRLDEDLADGRANENLAHGLLHGLTRSHDRNEGNL
jgi:hypothetical protein